MASREGARRRGRAGHSRDGRGSGGLPKPLPPLVNPLGPLELLGQDQLMRIVDAAFRVLERARKGAYVTLDSFADRTSAIMATALKILPITVLAVSAFVAVWRGFDRPAGGAVRMRSDGSRKRRWFGRG